MADLDAVELLPPLVEGARSMTLLELTPELLTGSRLTREEWDDPGYFIYLSPSSHGGDSFLLIHKPDGTLHNLIVRRVDLEADDWVTLEEILSGTPSPSPS